MKRKFLVPVVLAVLIGAGWYGWTRLRADSAATVPPTRAAARMDLERTVLASGIIEASKLVSVGARVSGQIKTLSVTLGDHVEAGDLIATINSSDQENAVLNAQANLKELAAEAAAQQASIHVAQLTLDRKQALNDRQLLATEDYQTAAATLEVAQANLKAIEARRDQAQVALEKTQTELARTRITAPISGTVVAVVISEGQTVNAVQTSPTIIKIADLADMVVTASVSEADVIGVVPGLAAHFTLPGARNRQFDATLRSVAPAPASIETADEISGTEAIYYDALLDVPNPDGILRIGMTAEVTIVLARAEGVLAVPAGAVTTRDGASTVEIWDPSTNRTETRRVETGFRNDTWIEIKSGIAEGEKAVVPGARLPAASGQRGGLAGRPLLGRL